MDQIKLLHYKYFLGAVPVGGKSNAYSGSVSLQPAHHCAFDEEFKYKVSLQTAEDGENTLLAQCYVGSVCFALTPPEAIRSQSFEGSDDGVEQAKAWLASMLEAAKKERSS